MFCIVRPLPTRLYIIIEKDKYYNKADFKLFVEYFDVLSGKTDVHLICL